MPVSLQLTGRQSGEAEHVGKASRPKTAKREVYAPHNLWDARNHIFGLITALKASIVQGTTTAIALTGQ